MFLLLWPLPSVGITGVTATHRFFTWMLGSGLVPQVLSFTETFPQVELLLKTEACTVMVAWLSRTSQWSAGVVVWVSTLGLDPWCASGFAKPLIFLPVPSDG